MLNKRRRILLIIVFACFAFSRMFTLIDDDAVYQDPFPLYDFVDEKTGELIPFYQQYYWFHVGQYVWVSSLFLLLWLGTKTWAFFGKYAFWFHIADLGDFCARYNESFVDVLGYPLEFTDFQMLMYFVMAIIYYHRWNQLQQPE